MATPSKTKNSSSQRVCGPMFSLDEDKAICRSYVAFPLDSVNDVQQPHHAFCRNIFTQFCKVTGNPKNHDVSGLSSRFGTISKDLNSWIALMMQMTRQRGSVILMLTCKGSLERHDKEQEVRIPSTKHASTSSEPEPI